MEESSITKMHLSLNFIDFWQCERMLILCRKEREGELLAGKHSKTVSNIHNEPIWSLFAVDELEIADTTSMRRTRICLRQ